MIKRIAIAILLLPVWFVVLWALYAVVVFLNGAAGYAVANIFQVDVAGLYKNPPVLMQALQSSWEHVVAQYGQNSQAFSQVVKDDANRFEMLYGSTLVLWVTTAAVIGAVVFSLSKISNGMRRAMLVFRRLITAPIVLGLLFPLLSLLFMVAATLVAHIWVAASTGAELQKTAHTDDAEQMKTIIQKPVMEAVQQFDVHYGVMMMLGAVALALIFTLFFTEKLVFLAWLPWCGKEATGSTGPAVPKKK